MSNMIHEVLPTASVALMHYVLAELEPDEPDQLYGNTGLPAAVDFPVHDIIVSVTPVKVRLARQARTNDTDVLHLEYGTDDDGRYGLTGMVVFMVRGDICHIQTQCRLFLSKGGTRGVVLPQPGARGHYRLAPGEILHIDGKPAGDVTNGMARADAWLARQLALGSDTADDGRYQVWSQAA